jgi:hypothetical protein
VAESDDATRRKYAILFLVTLREHSTSDAIKCALDFVVRGIAEIIMARCQSATENHSSLLAEDVADISDDETLPKEVMVHASVLEILLDHFGSMLRQDENFSLVSLSYQ